ncbi:MAG: DNA-processing protein DprA [Candidatus Omnitrophota bacterium]
MVERFLLSPDSPNYPAVLKSELYWKPPKELIAIGNANLLPFRKLGFFCSSQCPGNAIVRTYDLVKGFSHDGLVIIGGFHSPIEAECLRLLLRGKSGAIICPARSIETMRIPSAWKSALEANRLLILSPFPSNQPRMTRELAEYRNEFVAALADAIFIAHAAPASQTEAFAHKIAAWEKPLYTIDVPANRGLIELGARPGEKIQEVT